MQNAWAHKYQKGFTIVELLIVIVIIGILAAITIVAYNGVQNRARVSVVTADLVNAYKQLTAYQISNSAYPASLAVGGVNETGGTTFQYAVNNGVSPQTFCITGTNGDVSYKVSESVLTPIAGGCSGHGVGGIAPVTNLALNPSFEAVATQHAMYNGATMARTAVGDAASGAYVGRVTKGTAGSGLVCMIYPVTWAANTPISVRFKVRLSPGSTSTNTVSSSIQSYNGGTGMGGAIGGTTTPAGALSTTTWKEVVMQGYTTPNVTMNQIGIQINAAQPWIIGDGIEIDSEIIVQASTVPNFADGNTTSWVWNGTTNNSTSTGPPQ